MSRPSLEVADIFRAYGPAYRRAHAGHLSLGQLKVMSAIEACRSAELGGHVARCDDCQRLAVSYNSCRNRHCPKCQGSAAKVWLAERQADLLPAPYFHVVFTLPARIAAIAFHNKALVYDLLFKTAAETLQTIAADPKRLGARLGLIAVLHTWGSALTHHPHVHCIVPGGGLSPDGRWIACRKGFFLPVRVLSRFFRRLFLERLSVLHVQGRLRFFGDLAALAAPQAFAAHLAPLRRAEWVVYAKPPFGGPSAVLAYLARYTHRVAISSSRLVSLNDQAVRFRWKDYRRASTATGAVKMTTMALSPAEFIRRFLIHVLPSGFHRIRHYGLLAKGPGAVPLDRLRALILERTIQPVGATKLDAPTAEAAAQARTCPGCGGSSLRIIEVIGPGGAWRARPLGPVWCDSS
jgi:Zn finger protein HypA/HybF involved in hydrogenase expression